MAITKVIDQPTKREERTDEVVISAPLGQGYHVRVLRVTRDFFADAPPVEVGRRWLVRDMARLLRDSSALPLLGALPSIFDRWSQEDDLAALTLAELEVEVIEAQQVAATAQATLTVEDANVLRLVGVLNAALLQPDLEARRVAQAEADAATVRLVAARAAVDRATAVLEPLVARLAVLRVG